MLTHRKILLLSLFVSLFLTTIIYNYTDSNSVSHPTIECTDITIEETLKQISICTPNDRPRQRSLLSTLQAWAQFAHEHHIHYWIAYGTLVGYVQRHGILPHDEDIDILMLAEDTKQLFELAQSNFSSTYELKVHPQWATVGYWNRSYLPLQGIHFVAPNARFISREDRRHVEVWPTYKDHPDQSKTDSDRTAMLTEYNKSFEWISSPRDWTFPLESCEFSNIKVWCPAKPRQLVSAIYGTESLNKTDKTCINGSWIEL